MPNKYYGEAWETMQKEESERTSRLLFENKEQGLTRKVPNLWDYYQDQRGGTCNGH